MGTIFAHDVKAYTRWRQASRRAQAAQRGSRGNGLTGAELEVALMAMAVTNPDIVAIRRAT